MASFEIKFKARGVAQSYKLTNGVFMPREWITEKWDEGYYITAVAGAADFPYN